MIQRSAFAPLAVGLAALCVGLLLMIRNVDVYFAAGVGSAAEWVSGVSTVLLLFLAFFEFRTQIGHARQTLAETQRAAANAEVRAVELAQHNAASLQQVAATTRIAAAQQRAWVGLENVAISAFSISAPRRAVVTLKNFGTAPALDCVVRSYLGTGPPDIQPVLTYPEIDSRPAKIVMWPGKTHHNLVGGSLVTPEDFDAVAKGTLAIFIWSRITYRDPSQLPTEPPRETYACSVWLGPNKNVLGTSFGNSAT